MSYPQTLDLVAMSKKNSRRRFAQDALEFWRLQHARKNDVDPGKREARPPTEELLRVARKLLDHPFTKVVEDFGDLEMKNDTAIIRAWVEKMEAQGGESASE